MANWKECDEVTFYTFLSRIRGSQDVHAEHIMAKSMHIYYTGDFDYRSPEAIWVAKHERVGRDDHFYITNTQ